MSDASVLPPPPPGTMPDPEPPHRSRQAVRRRVAVVAMIAVAAIGAGGAGAWLGTRGGGSSDTERIVAVLRQAGDRVEFADDARVLDVGNDCIVRNPRILTRSVPDGVDLGAAPRAPRVASIHRLGRSDDPVAFECALTDGVGDAIGVAVFPTPIGPYDEYLERSLGAGGAVAIEPITRGDGGDIVAYCVDREVLPTCGADWSDGDLVVGVYGTDLDASQAEAWLRTIVHDVLDDLAVLTLDDIDIESDDGPDNGPDG